MMQKDVIKKLQGKFNIAGIPTLIILDKEGNVITSKGREAVSKDPNGNKFPWSPTPFWDLLGDKVHGTDGNASIAT